MLLLVDNRAQTKQPLEVFVHYPYRFASIRSCVLLLEVVLHTRHPTVADFTGANIKAKCT